MPSVLKIDGVYEPFQFIDTAIAISVSAEDPANKKSKPANLVPSSVSVQVFASPVEDIADLFVQHKSISQSSGFTIAEDAVDIVQIAKQGNNVSVTCKFKVLSLHRSNSAFYLKISAEGFSASVWTTPFYVVKHKLKVLQQPPLVWYKDQGGRKNNIHAKIIVVDKNQKKVSEREVQLKVDLVGEGKENQKMNHLCTLISQGTNTKQGEFELLAKINEVSKRNQNLRFRFIIAPDTAPQYGDVAACITDPITVLSKSNNPASTKFAPDSNEAAKEKIDDRVLKDFDSLGTLLKSLEWRVVGYEYVYVNETAAPNFTTPIFRCPVCFAYKNAKGTGSHTSNCWIPHAIRVYNNLRIQAFPLRSESSGKPRTFMRSSGNSKADRKPAIMASFQYNDDAYSESSASKIHSPTISSDDQSIMNLPELTIETPSGSVRQSSEEFIGFQMNSPRRMVSSEQDVFAIRCPDDLGRSYSAFDFYGTLIGFYELDTSQCMIFKNLSQMSLDFADKNHLEDQFRKDSQDRSGNIYILQNFDGNLDYMKNYIALCHD